VKKGQQQGHGVEKGGGEGVAAEAWCCCGCAHKRMQAHMGQSAGLSTTGACCQAPFAYQPTGLEAAHHWHMLAGPLC